MLRCYGMGTLLLLAFGAVAGCGGDDAARSDAGAGRDGGAAIDAGGGEADAAVGTDGGSGDGGRTRTDAGPPPPCAAPTLPDLTTAPIAGDHRFVSPLFVAQAPGAATTLWVVEQAGRIVLVRDGAALPTPFLDIRGQVQAGGERGLLGLAFHPDYASNGRFFVYYTPVDVHANVIAEYHVSADPDVADGSEVARLVEQPDPESNHDGGGLAFGPDGYLYAGLGDGGGGGDDHGAYGNGLNTDILLGKLLRLDVDATAADYAAATNPFVGGGGRPQIWAYGLRNPWRFSFDRDTGDLYIADVGQNEWEEIDVQPASSGGGENYGWRAYEAFTVFDSGNLDRATNHTEPILAIRHDGDDLLSGACSITGGYVYRGAAIPALRGTYLFGDYCARGVAALRYCDGALQGTALARGLAGAGAGLASFGEDLAGEIYLVYVRSGDVLKVVAP